jgi:hypothetical protein
MKKRASHASHDENAAPGSHAEPSAQAAHIMRAVIQAVTDAFPGTQIAVIVMDSQNAERFNYASNCDRKDMVAILEATAHRIKRETQ